MVCNVLEAKYIKVFLKPFGRILHWEMHTGSSFLKKRLMWSLWLWDPLYQSLQILKRLGDFTAEARETVGTVECYGFFAYWAIFELGTQNSGRLFFFLSLSLWVCVFWWLVRLFTVSRVSGPAVWPVCHELDKNGDIQFLVPCSWWVFYINWIIGCFNCPWSGCSGEGSVAPIGGRWRFPTVVTFSAFAWPALLDAWGTAEPHERTCFLNGEPVAAYTWATLFRVGLGNPSRG